MEQNYLFVFLKILFIITTPVTFLVGVFLLYDLETYMRIEKFFAKSYFLSKKTFFIEQLDRNRESLQLFLLKKRRFVGIICLLNSVMSIFLVTFLLRGY